MSVSTTFGHHSPSQSFSVAPGSGVFGAGGASPAPAISSQFRKTFAVSSLKSLNRRQTYVLVLEFERNLVSFHKVRRGKEVKRSFPFHSCVKLEREAKNSCQLTTIFGHEPRYKKALFFEHTEERELFCNLVHAMIVSGARAVKLFKSLQTAGGASDAAADGGAVSIPGHDGDAVQAMDFCEFLISFSSAQTQVSNSQALGSNAPAGGGMSFADEAGLGSGRARANASDPQAAIMAFLTENNGAHADNSSGINALATSNLVSLLNGRMLEGEKPVNSNDITYRVECSCGGIGQIVMYKRAHHSNGSSDVARSGITTAVAGASNGSNGNVEISSKDGTGITASSRGLFLLTNYRILYVNYNENNSFAAHEASTNYTSYMNPNGASHVESALSPASPSNNHVSQGSSSMCTCDGDIPLGLINRVIKSTSRDGCEIKLLLKDGRKIEFGFDGVTAKWVEGLVANIQKMAFPKDQSKLFAFQYSYNPQAANRPSAGLSPFPAAQINGWDLYDALQDYTRVTLATDPSFRVVGSNVDFKLCGSYPRWIIEPASMPDDEIKQIALYRSQSRLPAVVWIHPITRATLSRCAQPLVGLKGKRSEFDEKLVSILRTGNPSNSSALHIFDARPWKAAIGNQAMGKGMENTAHYEKVSLSFMNIDNIHAIRHSLEKLQEVCGFSDSTPPPVGTTSYYSSFKASVATPAPSTFITGSSSATVAFDESFLAKLQATLWCHYVRLVLSAAQMIAVAMTEEGASCITHCSDGWDRTSQLAALTELMLDPFYRTMEGFAILIEKEWLSFGHRFAERYGHASHEHDDEQRAPIFVQFLDCVYQLMHQFPASFEFTDDYLLAIHDHVSSCRFGTFLYNCSQERELNDLRNKTVSLWTFLLHSDIRTKFHNAAYVHPPHVQRWNAADVPDVQARTAAMIERAQQQQANPAPGRGSIPPPASALPEVLPLTSSPSAAIISSFFCIPSVSAKRIVLWEKMHLRHEREYLRTQSQLQHQIAMRVNQARAAKVSAAVPVVAVSASIAPAAADVESAWMAKYNILMSRLIDAGIDTDKLESGMFIAPPPGTSGNDSSASSSPSPTASSTIIAAASSLISPLASASSLTPATAADPTRVHRPSLTTSQLVTLKAGIDTTALTAGKSQLRSPASQPIMPARAPPAAPVSPVHEATHPRGSVKITFAAPDSEDDSA